VGGGEVDVRLPRRGGNMDMQFSNAEKAEMFKTYFVQKTFFDLSDNEKGHTQALKGMA